MESFSELLAVSEANRVELPVICYAMAFITSV